MFLKFCENIVYENDLKRKDISLHLDKYHDIIKSTSKFAYSYDKFPMTPLHIDAAQGFLRTGDLVYIAMGNGFVLHSANEFNGHNLFK